MNTTFARQSSLALAVGLILFGGCARPSAQSEQPRSVAMAPAPSAPLLTSAASPAPQLDAAPAVVTNPAPTVPPPVAATTDSSAALVEAGESDTNAPVIQAVIPPTQLENMSAGVHEIIKLAQAGVGEDVILAYIEKYPGPFDVNADEIIYLNDLGISTPVITAMLQHDGSDPALAEAVQAAPSMTQTQAVSNVPLNQVYTQPPPPEQQDAQANTAPPIVEAAPAPSTEVAYFYDSLSPYGSWMYVGGYGWSWQPTVAVAAPGWRPYSDRGRWYWSDSGWYWHSDYTWGWAPFHYGRWYHHSGRGWLWTPGTVWGPAWVSWRYADGYCGWAPLPPAAVYAPGFGFSYYGRHVSVGFDFGLRAHHYAFVSVANFCDYSPNRYIVHHARAVDIHRRTRVVNNYVVQNNKVINHGVGRETVARSSRTAVRDVAVRPQSGGVRAERMERQGNQTVVYRPELPKDPPVKPAVVANRMAANLNQSRVARADGSGATGRGQSAPGSGGRTSRASIGEPSSAPAPARMAPNPGGGSRASEVRRDQSRRVEQTQPAPNQPAPATGVGNRGNAGDRQTSPAQPQRPVGVEPNRQITRPAPQQRDRSALENPSVPAAKLNPNAPGESVAPRYYGNRPVATQPSRSPQAQPPAVTGQPTPQVKTVTPSVTPPRQQSSPLYRAQPQQQAPNRVYTAPPATAPASPRSVGREAPHVGSPRSVEQSGTGRSYAAPAARGNQPQAAPRPQPAPAVRQAPAQRAPSRAEVAAPRGERQR